MSALHENGTDVTLLFFRDNLVREFSFPSGKPFNLDDLHCGGGTPLRDAVQRALTIVSELPAGTRGIINIITDGQDTTSRTSPWILRDRYRVLKETHPDTALFMVSSAPDAVAFASFLEMKRENVLALDGEENRGVANQAARRVWSDCLTSSSLRDVCFSVEEHMSSEPSHYWQSHSSSDNGSSGVTLDGTVYPGVVADVPDDFYGGPSDHVWSACDRN
jgi:hypothetical protein